MTNATAAEAKLREIVDGLEGVTPGPWQTIGSAAAEELYVFVGPREIACVRYGESHPPREAAPHPANAAHTARHIARCDPQTIREISAAFEAMKRERDELRLRERELAEMVAMADESRVQKIHRAIIAEAQVSSLKAENERLRKALSPFAEIATRVIQGHLSGHVGDDDNLVCKAGDCFRARTALENKP